MTKRSLLLSTALGVLCLLAVPSVTEAATYVSYHCHCTIAAGSDKCSCEYDYTLGKSATKEFRGYCDGDVDKSIDVSNRDSGTTCTVSALGFGGYKSRSCTNWDPFSTDHVKVKVSCESKSDFDSGPL